MGKPKKHHKNKRSINPSIPELDQSALSKQMPLQKEQSFVTALMQVPLLPGRHTQPVNWNPFANVTMLGNNLGFYFLPKKEPQTIQVEDIDSGAWSPGGLVNVLTDVSPDVSKALWNNLRLTGTKLSLKALTMDGKDDVKGQDLINECLSRINPYYGGIDNTLTTMGLSIYTFGAVATDSEIGYGYQRTLDLYPVVPDTIWFQRDIEQKPIPYQLQYMWGYTAPPFDPMAMQSTLPFRRLSQATFKYTPFDPAIDDPYGRGPFWPVLQVIFFLAQLLRDLQRVVENQAWPHTDFKLNWEILSKMMESLAPQDLHNPQGFSNFLGQKIAEIQNQYSSLSPQDAFVHADFLEVNQAVMGGRLFDVPAVVGIVERQIIKALKQLPIFMDIEATASQTETATQFEIMVHGIERGREILTDHLIYHCMLNHWMNGHQGKINGSWPEIRTTQRLQDAQADNVEIHNAAYKRDQGWIDQDQASLMVTGSVAVKKEPDWDHIEGQKDASVPKGEDKDTNPNTVAGSTKAKNKRITPKDIDWDDLRPLDLEEFERGFDKILTVMQHAKENNVEKALSLASANRNGHNGHN